MKSTTIYEDNIACIAQLKEWYIKDLFTKSLPRTTLEQLVHKCGLGHFKDESYHEGEMSQLRSRWDN